MTEGLVPTLVQIPELSRSLTIIHEWGKNPVLIRERNYLVLESNLFFFFGFSSLVQVRALAR